MTDGGLYINAEYQLKYFLFAVFRKFC